jgi:hypothetical protein
MPVFKTAKISLFREDRAKAIEDFAEKVMDYLSKDYPSDKCFGDIAREGGIEWQVLGNQKFWIGDSNPLKNSAGSLDFIAACLDEGIAIKRIWNQIGAHGYDSIVSEMVMRGLHSIHFRMDVANEADRIAYTCSLAGELLDDAAQNPRLPRMRILSATTREMNGTAIGLLVNPPSGDGDCQQITIDQAAVLSHQKYRGETHEDEDSFFRQAVADYLQVSLIDKVSNLVIVIEKAMVPLVYNFGYKLKAQGIDSQTVMHQASKRIDVLLSHVEMSKEFKVGLQRQILINLFSAFPDGLELLKAQPEELQGVMLDHALVSDPLARLFTHTLQGPLALFAHSSVKPEKSQAGKIIEYLAQAGYQLKLDTAIQGILANKYPLIHLAYQQDGASQGLERTLERDGLEAIHRAVGQYLSEPSRLSQYSDLTVLKLISGALDFELETRDTMKFVPNLESRAPSKYASVALVLKARPHLFVPVLEMLEEKKMLTAGIFEWCGFDGRAIKALGNRAPKELKVMLLESGLGL